MKKRLIALATCLLLAMPVQAEMFTEKEKREDGTFDVTSDEVIEYAGLQKMDWSEDWKPIVAMLLGEEKDTLLALFEPESNTFYEELYVYVSPHGEVLKEKVLQDLLIGVKSYNDRKKATVSNETEVGTDKYDATFYSYVLDDKGHFNLSMNTGSAILDFIYEYPMGTDHPNMDSFLEMCDTIEFEGR